GELFAPQAGYRPITLDALSLAQIIVGLFLTFGFLTKIAALGVLALVIFSFWLVGLDGLDYVVLAGAAFGLLFVGGLRASVDAFTIARTSHLRRIGDSPSRVKPVSIPIRRVSFVIKMLWLALTVKLLVLTLSQVSV